MSDPMRRTPPDRTGRLPAPRAVLVPRSRLAPLAIALPLVLGLWLTIGLPILADGLKKFEAEVISPADAALWKRGASNAGYHYLGCAKTFALMGKAFAEATLQMMKEQPGR